MELVILINYAGIQNLNILLKILARPRL